MTKVAWHRAPGGTEAESLLAGTAHAHTWPRQQKANLKTRAGNNQVACVRAERQAAGSQCEVLRCCDPAAGLRRGLQADDSQVCKCSEDSQATVRLHS